MSRLTRRLPRKDEAPVPLFLDDHAAYAICAELNRGDCLCQWHRRRACEAMERIAAAALDRVKAHPDLPRRARTTSGDFL